MTFSRHQRQYGDSEQQESQDATDRKDDAQSNSQQPSQDLSYTITSHIQKGPKPINLTEHIRKANKIQIKKRFEQESQNACSPDSILNQANKLFDENYLSKALKKYLEYIKLEPLDVEVHQRIGMIYTSIGQKDQMTIGSPSDSASLQTKNEMTNSLEEAILHFE